MNDIHYIGFDVHKQTIQYCTKRADGKLVEEGRIAATHAALAEWARGQKTAWKGAMEATMFTAWIYDDLAPHAVELKVAHSALLEAIAVGKHASDRLDARTICDLARANLIPSVWMAPPEIRALRTKLRYRNLVVRQATQTMNRIGSTLMEQGVEYVKSKLHGRRYFQQLVEGLPEVPEAVRTVLRYGRGSLEMFESTQRLLLRQLRGDPQLAGRVKLLRTIPGVGEITALTWALEIGDPQRFQSAGRAMSYCGLVAPLQESAGKRYRQPLSKKRNAHLQTILIEAAHLAPRYHPALRRLYDETKERKHAGAAVLAVARKLVSYLLSVDKSRQPFQVREPATAPSSPTGKAAFPPAPPTGGAAVARRSSPSRVRCAAASEPAAPLTAPDRRAVKATAMGGSDGKATPRPRCALAPPGFQHDRLLANCRPVLA
jgi:transposase